MKVLRAMLTGLALATPVLAAADCGMPGAHGPAERGPARAAAAAETVRFNGVVRWVDLEGGFYALETRQGVKYDPMNLPEEYRKDGLAVRVEGRIRTDVGSFHMYGKILEITSIRAL